MIRQISKVLLSVFVLFVLCTNVMAQGNNYGLGNKEEADVASLSSRLLNLEERSHAFQFYVNLRGGLEENLDGENKGGHLRFAHIRPEFLGDLGKWSYRLRLNLGNNHSYNETDGTNDIVDVAKIFYSANKNWSFSFGRSTANYGTFEFDWNPVHVLHYYEFQDNQSNVVVTSATADFNTHNQQFTFEVANAGMLPSLALSPKAQERFSPHSHPFQYSFAWRGNLFGNRLKTIWSYTLRSEAKGHPTSLIMLGTSYKIGKFDLQLDYNGAFGKVDYLGIATADAQMAGLLGEDDMAARTQYKQWVLDVGFWLAKRWNIFTKLGVSSSSSSEIKQLNNYRNTYEYSLAAMYALDKAQDVRLSLSYYGKTIDYKKAFALKDKHTNCIELSLVCRLKIL